MDKTIEFYNTPALTREYVNNWLVHMKKHKHSPAHVAVLEDVLKLIDVAMTFLQPAQAEPANNNK